MNAETTISPLARAVDIHSPGIEPGLFWHHWPARQNKYNVTLEGNQTYNNQTCNLQQTTRREQQTGQRRAAKRKASTGIEQSLNTDKEEGS
eukprot:2935287-Ditylum_brightwellii.AAC.1